MSDGRRTKMSSANERDRARRQERARDTQKEIYFSRGIGSTFERRLGEYRPKGTYISPGGSLHLARAPLSGTGRNGAPQRVGKQQ